MLPENLGTTLSLFAYVIAAAFFILGIKNLGSPVTAPRGNRLAAIGMLIAIIVTLLDQRVLSYELIAAGIIVGSLIGAASARLVKMTAMPQMVALFNGFGGGASALVGSGEYFRILSTNEAWTGGVFFTILLGVFIGCVTFSGSMIAFGKLQGIIRGTPIVFPLQQPINILLCLLFLAGSVYLWTQVSVWWVFVLLAVLALGLGKLFVIPIGGADMPVVIALLNSFSGIAASIAGFIIMNNVLIISGALVGASGLILTKIMCKAMNRSLVNVLFSGFGKKVQSAAGPAGAQDKTVRSIDAEEGAMVLAYTKKVVVVPGYGMAVAQAQHSVRELADLLEQRGVDVKYGIHPVAGRMPGHMNVLLAEANVPYSQLKDMDDINPEFDKTDVVLVIGANDVVNPAAKNAPGSPIYGMPILEVDRAKNIIVIKRSLNPGFAGIDNELFYNEKTMMLFGSAREMVAELTGQVKQL